MHQVIYGILSDAERHDQMQTAVNLHWPFLQKAQRQRKGAVSICAYGPSLLDTWRLAKTYQKINHRPIITVSGAHDFLVSRGVIPDFHVEIDPRAHKPKMLTKPQAKTQYLMATVCHPDFWDVLDGCDVRLWHMVNDHETVKWVASHHPAGLQSMIGGGSTAGQRAINVAAALGFREFHVFGMDMSFQADRRHAGEHTGEPEPPTIMSVGGREFKTTKQLAQSAREMEEFLNNTEGIKIAFHGDGLVQEMAYVIQKRKREV